MFSVERFPDWLLNELNARDMSQSDLARSANLGRGTISNIMTGTRSTGKEVLVKIARALKLPTDAVFRAAGLLPPQYPESELISRIIHITSELPEEDQTEILEYAQLRHRLAEERGKNATQGSRKTTTKPKQV